MITIEIFSHTGKFAENKDVAKELRIKKLMPNLEKGHKVTIDFVNVESTTQSFIHALISDSIRKFNIDILDKIEFKNCNERVKIIIEIVVDYMQTVLDLQEKS